MSFLNNLFQDPKYQTTDPRKPEEIEDPEIIISPDTQRENRMPPGQSRTKKWPVLDAHGTPDIELTTWSFEVDGLVEHPQKWSLDEFMQLGAVRVYADFHCVTRWSRLDNVWSGVSAKEIARLAGVKPEAKFVLALAYDYGWTTNVPIEYFLNDDSLFAWSHDGQPIPPEHGGPVRLIIPQLYAWKSAKWVKGVRFLEHDQAGFWEEGGYHMRGVPWGLATVSDTAGREAMPERLAPPSIPKDAAAIILLRQDTDPADPEVFWVKRSDKLAFLGGFHAFPGGQIDASDAEVHVRNSPNAATAAMISGAARELFEELGILAVRGGHTLTKGQRVSILDDLEAGRMTWPAILDHYELHLDADDFTFVGRWVTPPFNARRFDTWFFLVNCPAKQDPNVIAGELASGEWLTAREAYESWLSDQVVAVPPTLHALRTLAAGVAPNLVERFLSIPQAQGEPARRITFRPNYICFPVRTPTRPPATHTCCYLVHNSKEILIFDPGSPYEDEQEALAACVDEMISEGRQVREIILTHLHPDHVGGVNALKKHLGGAVPVAAHAQTAEALSDVHVDRFIQDNDVISLEGEPPIHLRGLHTPGHALGHLCFHDEARGVLLTGDNIVGVGSVLIDPPQGNMRDYLNSLERMRSLPNLTVLFGGHGPAVATPYQKIDEYISHRLEREQNILQAVRSGATNPKEIVASVYTDVSPKAHAMAERAVLAHLKKLREDGLVKADVNGNWNAARQE